MRARLIFVIVAVLLVATFASLNWSEFVRPAPLSFGLGTITNAPLGLIMLTLLGITLLAWIISSAATHSQRVREANRYAHELQAQRDLAEKAEASRFTDLREQLDSHLRENRERGAIVASDFEKSVVLSQRELRMQLDQMNRSLESRLSELEGRIGSRLERLAPPAVTTSRVEEVRTDVPAPSRDHIKL
jgi:DNA anti-recombination protein RmuC